MKKAGAEKMSQDGSIPMGQDMNEAAGGMGNTDVQDSNPQMDVDDPHQPQYSNPTAPVDKEPVTPKPAYSAAHRERSNTAGMYLMQAKKNPAY
jgi:hypothetical protein